MNFQANRMGVVFKRFILRLKVCALTHVSVEWCALCERKLKEKIVLMN